MRLRGALWALCATFLWSNAFAASDVLRTKGVDYACVNLVDLAKIKKAARTEDTLAITTLMQKGCFVTLPRWKLKKVGEWGLAIQVEGTPKDFGFQNTLGMEKISTIKVWMHQDNLHK